jgi:hypothetical protein
MNIIQTAKIATSLLILSSSALIAGPEEDDANARRLFVTAVMEWQKAETLHEDDIVQRAESINLVQSALDTILQSYPDSGVAQKLKEDGRLGPLSPKAVNAAARQAEAQASATDCRRNPSFACLMHEAIRLNETEEHLDTESLDIMIVEMIAKSGDEDWAMEFATREGHPDISADAHKSLATFAAGSGDVAKARHHLSLSTTDEPRFEQLSKIDVATAMARAGNVDDALMLAREVDFGTLDPFDPIAEELIAQEDRDRALAVIKEGVSYAREKSLSLFLMDDLHEYARKLHRIGETSLARELYDEAVVEMYTSYPDLGSAALGAMEQRTIPVAADLGMIDDAMIAAQRIADPKERANMIGTVAARGIAATGNPKLTRETILGAVPATFPNGERYIFIDRFELEAIRTMIAANKLTGASLFLNDISALWVGTEADALLAQAHAKKNRKEEAESWARSAVANASKEQTTSSAIRKCETVAMVIGILPADDLLPLLSQSRAALREHGRSDDSSLVYCVAKSYARLGDVREAQRVADLHPNPADRITTITEIAGVLLDE